MSAWPEAVWIVDQIQSNINLNIDFERDLEQFDNSLSQMEKIVNNFVNNSLFTTIINEGKWSDNSYIQTENTRIPIKETLAVNGATVFVADSISDWETIENKIKNRYNNLNN